MYFFTADTHFFQETVIRHSGRPFGSASEMNAFFVKRWNERVRKTDRVYHLGDLSFGGASETLQLLAELNGEICLITGNHDDLIINNPFIQKRFLWVKPYHEEIIDGRLVVMFHYPIAQWREAQRGSWHLYGHTHGTVQLTGACLDVGVDTNLNFYSWDEIQERLKNIPSLPYPKK